MDSIEQLARRAAPACEAWSVRAASEVSERIAVRQDVPDDLSRSRDAGAMVTVIDHGAIGHAATSDLSEAGLREAFGRAHGLARAGAALPLFDAAHLELPSQSATWRSPGERPAGTASLADRVALLQQACASMKTSDAIVERVAGLWSQHVEQVMVTSSGGRIEQAWHLVVPILRVVASVNGDTQVRSANDEMTQQGGLEVLERVGFLDRGPQLAEEALQLVHAPNCPSGEMDVLLAPDQMILQIHESIGHPLELDRILGDERNFAGTSFVTLDMFGQYRYGSELLNVSFAPDVPGELAAFAFDDDGTPAQREWLIREGILLRPLGGSLSQARARQLRPDIAGVATARASSWNRPTIDRMSNLNVEPGSSSFDEMVASIDNGIFLRTNQSWSIDDSRNKFQFGCQWGQRIRGGKLAEVVKRPNYRGISASFWRSLAMVGNADTFRVMGTPFCGKGEPSQVIRVGHASPACKFSNVTVFGGAA